MAAEPSSRSATGGGAATGESYIGSLISLTSKSEIRYEGILYNINTDESSIGLRNVRSFGTEGRKKDGPQVPASDKIYEYILFRGSDIKDLQVKSSPPSQPTSIPNDPAIIQSHYSPSTSHPTSTSPNVPSAGIAVLPDLSSQAAQMAIQRPALQGTVPLYQPGGVLTSWGSSGTPPTAGVPGLAMPSMYWPGFYPPNIVSQLKQPTAMLQPPPGISVPTALQYPPVNVSLLSGPQKLPEIPAHLLQHSGVNLNLSSSTLPSTSATTANTLLPENTHSLLPTTVASSSSSASVSTSIASLSINPLNGVLPSSELNSIVPTAQSISSFATGNKPASVAGTALTHQATQITPSNTSSSLVETSMPFVSSVQVLHADTSLPPPASLPPISQSMQTSSQTMQKEFFQQKTQTEEERPLGLKNKVIDPVLPDPPPQFAAETKEPSLRLPKPSIQKFTGVPQYTHHNFRGHGRGRAIVHAQPRVGYTEDFDFTAMNEKFKKDEVWGHLGKGKSQFIDAEQDDDAVDVFLEEEREGKKSDTKPVYIKDEFFDSLSCSALDQQDSRNGRSRFSEQLKIDTETFGDFRRYRSNQGGVRGFYSSGRARGSFQGRGYGNMARGASHSFPNRTNYRRDY